MQAYTLVVSLRLKKSIRKIPIEARKKIELCLDKLSFNPRPNGCKKLKGRTGYRVRVGKYRILYKIFDEKITVLVLQVDHRKDIYK